MLVDVLAGLAAGTIAPLATVLRPVVWVRDQITLLTTPAEVEAAYTHHQNAAPVAS